ncbi:MucR family transcriptional regulator [Novosphingobium sp. BL-8H]|uniref:MucR family transcriptional regulator n=1 Tax=Novosphingobium sp. BL-8H TaxID=3127640 RepID=UPI003757FD42
MQEQILLELTSDIIAAHVSNNAVTPDQVPEMIQAVYSSLSALGAPQPTEQERTPAVSVRASVKSEALICLECSAKLKTLKRHLQTEHDLTPEAYRARWNLPSSYPMVSADYAERRRAIASAIGLGNKGGRKKQAPAGTATDVPEPGAGKPAKGRRKLGITT